MQHGPCAARTQAGRARPLPSPCSFGWVRLLLGGHWTRRCPPQWGDLWGGCGMVNMSGQGKNPKACSLTTNGYFCPKPKSCLPSEPLLCKGLGAGSGGRAVPHHCFFWASPSVLEGTIQSHCEGKDSRDHPRCPMQPLTGAREGKRKVHC